MGLAEEIAVIAGGIAGILTIFGSYAWWIYRRGQACGEAAAERKASQRAQAEGAAIVRMLETRLAVIQAELHSLRAKRRRA